MNTIEKQSQKTTNELLSEVAALGVRLWREGDRLRYAPKEKLSRALLAELRERKLEIIRVLPDEVLTSNAPPILRRPRDKDIPLSFAQQRLWFLGQMEPDSSAYNMPAAYRLTGSLDVNVLEQSFGEIMRRHEILRTTFPSVDGQAVQAIASHQVFTLNIVELQENPETKRETIAQKICKEEAEKPFALDSYPLFRAKLLRLSDREHILLVTCHHIIFDIWSANVFFKELTTLYTAFAKGVASPLPELPVQYADFTHWQREWLQGEVLESELSYWKQQLGGKLPALQLPTDRPRPPVQTYQGAYLSLELPKEFSKALKALSQQEGTTLFMTLLAAFQTLLHRYSGQEDIIVGTPVAGRNQIETEGLIGFFVNSLAIRTNLSGNPSFRQLLARVREVTLGAYNHQNLPFEKLVEELQPERDPSRSPLFQVMLAFENTPSQPWELSGAIATPLEIHSGTAKLELVLHLRETSENIEGGIEYNTDLFEPATIARMIGHFQTLLASIVANPSQRISEFPLLMPSERHQLLVEWNETQTNFPESDCIHQLFEKWVEQKPEAIAVIFENQELTYQQLNARANQLAHYLQEMGVGLEVLVGVCVERSLETIVGLLGILKAGGAYVPLDPSYPKERLAFMMEDSRVSVLLTQKKLASKLPENSAAIVCLDAQWETISKYRENNPVAGAGPENLAYVIYTSGSTGKPKGVLAVHKGLSNLAKAQIEAFGLREDSRVLQFASSSFDASISEIAIALSSGATLCLAKRENLLPGPALMGLLRDRAITLATLPPSALAVLPAEELPDLRAIVVAGEACSPDLVGQWSKGRKFLNAYGPTEATVCATVAECTDSSTKPPIGRPIANVQTYILDRNLQPVPIGVAGELYIGGTGIARGYLNRPELTARKFIANPFSNEPGASLYKTGDLARYLPDGNIDFLGRTDGQVKVRGFRIELGEVESMAAQYPGVRQAVVTVREDVPGDKRLVAYIVPHREVSLAIHELRHFLQQKLPSYMVPSGFVALERLPLTPNGKIDRRALPAPDQTRQELEETFVPARDELEIQLAKIWEKVLGIKPIGVKDNFFELGGHSLLALPLFVEIEKTFGKNLPLATLFQAPTVEQLAKILSQEDFSASWHSLVPIQPKGSKPPLFAIHSLGQGFKFYRDMSHHLGSDQPIYGLRYGLAAATGADAINAQPDLPIDHKILIEDYIKEMRTFQPEGPYLLAGVSVGGIIAFKIAQQLQAQGHEVGILALMDTNAPGYSLKPLPNTTPWSRYLLLWKQKIEMHSSYLATFHPKDKLSYIAKRAVSFSQHLVGGFYFKQALQVVKNSYRTKRASSAANKEKNTKTDSQTNPQTNPPNLPDARLVYPGKITLFRASYRAPGFYHDPANGWEGMADGGIETYEITGEHTTMLQEPHVRVLAKHLSHCINKALADE